MARDEPMDATISTGLSVVLGKNGAGQNNVVAKLFIEQRAHGAVDQTRDENAAVGEGLPSRRLNEPGILPTAYIRSSDLDGQREIVDAGLGGRGDATAVTRTTVSP